MHLTCWFEWKRIGFPELLHRGSRCAQLIHWVSGQNFAKLWIFYLVERLKSSRRHVLGEYVSLGAPSEWYWVNTCHWELPVNGIGWIRVTGRFFLDFSFSQQHVSFNSYLVKHYRLLIYLITMASIVLGNLEHSSRDLRTDSLRSCF